MRAVDRRVLQREMQGHQAVVAPVPGIELLAHVLGKQLLARHPHGGRSVDRARDEPPCLDRAAVGEAHRGRATVARHDLPHLGIGDHGAAVRLDQPRQRVREARRPAHRQGELHDVGEDQREHDAGARHALGGDDVHVRGEQRADAVVVEVLAHHAEQVVLGVREEFPGLRAGQPVPEPIDRKRRVEGERGEQRAHADRVGVVELAEGPGVARGEPRQRRAGPLHVLVDHHAGAVAERRTLLHRRLDVGEAEAVQLEVADERRMPEAHEEVGMQVEAIAGQGGLRGRGAAADRRISLQHGDLEAGARQVGGKREPVVPRTDHDAVVDLHVGLSCAPRSLRHCTSLRSTMAWMPLLPSTSCVTRRSQARLQNT